MRVNERTLHPSHNAKKVNGYRSNNGFQHGVFAQTEPQAVNICQIRAPKYVLSYFCHSREIL